MAKYIPKPTINAQEKLHLATKYNILRTKIKQKNPFYGLLLDDRANIVSSEKFINDPWVNGKDQPKSLAKGHFIVDENTIISIEEAAEIIANPQKFKKIATKYLTSFAWIRSLQTVGGNACRQHTRFLIMNFINFSKKTPKFWKTLPWSAEITAERMLNWMLAFSFYASGADDKFQKNVLSMLTKQYSHLSKIYQGIIDQYAKILVIKSMFFFLSSLKTRSSQINKILSIFCDLVRKNIDKDGFFISRNPIEHFNIFRSVIEVRFMARNCDIKIDFPVFYEKLSDIAACVRFLRLGDGRLSDHTGGSLRACHLFTPSSSNIDTALSLVDIKNGALASINGFEKIVTKQSSMLINTAGTDPRSKFHCLREPGINIFDFEASFGIERVINRGDTAIFFNKAFIKPHFYKDILSEKTVGNNELLLFGEFYYDNIDFSFVIRREFSISTEKCSIEVCDRFLVSAPCDVIIRLFFNKNTILSKKNDNRIAGICKDTSFVLDTFEANTDKKVVIADPQMVEYPSAYVMLKCLSGKSENFVRWKIAKT